MPFKNECEAIRNKATSETVMRSTPVSLKNMTLRIPEDHIITLLYC